MKLLHGFNEVSPFTLNGNVFDMLQNEWMLITAGDSNTFNTMTAAWGSFGIMWNKPVCIIYIRPQRFTFQFTEKFQTFSLSFFGHNNNREALSFCGSKSGRDFNKPKETGLTPVLTTLNNIAFQEARLIIDCKQLYADNIKSDAFLDKEIDMKVYPTKDYHRFYISEILSCNIKEG